jgi:hypothetical protein
VYVEYSEESDASESGLRKYLMRRGGAEMIQDAAQWPWLRAGVRVESTIHCNKRVVRRLATCQ